MKSNRSRSRITSHSEHVVTPSVRKSLFQDFMRCDEEGDCGLVTMSMVIDEPGSPDLGNLSLEERDFKSTSLAPFVPETEVPGGTCLELHAATKKQRNQPEDHISTTPKQSLSRVRRSLSFGAGSEFNLALMETGTDVIRTMVEKLSDNDSLIGDGSASHCLPTVVGKHIDIKSVSSPTLSEALRSGIKGRQIRLVDCRYPYEYKGGHIQGADSLYTHEQILSLLEEGSMSTGSGMAPQKLVFYCEFSSIRAPSMYRFLREKDRALNMDKYPALIYPEIYLLDGGYQAFFQSYKELCTPSAYVPMRSQSHLDDLRHFRTKSKSWAAGEKRRLYLKCLRL